MLHSRLKIEISEVGCLARSLARVKPYQGIKDFVYCISSGLRTMDRFSLKVIPRQWGVLVKIVKVQSIPAHNERSRSKSKSIYQYAKIRNSFSLSQKLIFSFLFNRSFLKITEAALTDSVPRHCCRLRPHTSLREHGSLFPARRSTHRADTDDLYRCLENIVKPNLRYAQ